MVVINNEKKDNAINNKPALPKSFWIYTILVCLLMESIVPKKVYVKLPLKLTSSPLIYFEKLHCNINLWYFEGKLLLNQLLLFFLMLISILFQERFCFPLTD